MEHSINKEIESKLERIKLMKNPVLYLNTADYKLYLDSSNLKEGVQFVLSDLLERNSFYVVDVANDTNSVNEIDEFMKEFRNEMFNLNKPPLYATVYLNKLKHKFILNSVI